MSAVVPPWCDCPRCPSCQSPSGCPGRTQPWGKGYSLVCWACGHAWNGTEADVAQAEKAQRAYEQALEGGLI